MFACLTIAGDGGNTRFSCSTVSIVDAIAPPQGSSGIECYSSAPAFKRNKDAPETDQHDGGARPAPAPRIHLREPLAPAAALPRLDCGAGDLRLALLAGALLPVDGDLRRSRSARARARLGHGGRRAKTDKAERDRADAGGPRADRRRHDLEPAHHGD